MSLNRVGRCLLYDAIICYTNSMKDAMNDVVSCHITTIMYHSEISDIIINYM